MSLEQIRERELIATNPEQSLRRPQVIRLAFSDNIASGSIRCSWGVDRPSRARYPRVESRMVIIGAAGQIVNKVFRADHRRARMPGKALHKRQIVMARRDRWHEATEMIYNSTRGQFENVCNRRVRRQPSQHENPYWTNDFNFVNLRRFITKGEFCNSLTYSAVCMEEKLIRTGTSWRWRSAEQFDAPRFRLSSNRSLTSEKGAICRRC